MSERTKLWIADQMKTLLVKKPLEKIRVSELCRMAEISKPTFYYHFRDKYDLVAWIFFRDAYATDITDPESAARSMAKMKKEMLFYKNAYEDISQNAFWRYMPNYFASEYIRIAKEKIGTDVLDPQIEYSIRLHCYGAVAMSWDWILHDNTTPAETIVRMMFASMPDFLQKIYF